MADQKLSALGTIVPDYLYGIAGGVSGKALPGSLIARTHLSSAEILALHTQPIEVVPAQGPNKVIALLSFYARTAPGVVAYTFAGDITFHCADLELGTGAGISNALTYTDIIEIVGTGWQPNIQNISGTGMANAPLVITANGGNPTLGDGEFDVWVVYQVISLT